MAISRHDEEWKRVVGLAMFAGVLFKQVLSTAYSKGAPIPDDVWLAMLPPPISANVEAPSKFQAAQKALRIMGGESWIEHE